MTADFLSHVVGLRLFGREDYPPWAQSCDFQTTASFDSESARQVLSHLPSDLQLCYADPERGNASELTYVFVRRADDRFFETTRVHASSSPWMELPFERVVSGFALSRLVRSSLEDFASFTVQTIPAHQRDEHLGRAT
jgi:hypothetical protein